MFNVMVTEVFDSGTHNFQNTFLQSQSEEKDALKLHTVGNSLGLVPKGR